MSLEIENIIVKFLNREANIQELDILDVWLKDDNNALTFNYFVRTEYISNASMADYDVDKAKEAIKQRLEIKGHKRRFIVVAKRMAIAASIALIFGAAFFMLDRENSALDVPDVTPIVIQAGVDKAILTLDNGKEVALEKGKEYTTGKAMSNGKEIVYSPDGKKESTELELKYNYLTIPRGGQFFVQLSDGTEVWLNSESKLRYPIKFQEGKTRQVELVYGEAYFKVSPSTKHAGAEFHVQTKYQEVSVLGTQFNVKAYKDVDEIATTLVEGKVKIQKGVASEILKPNQQSRISSSTDEIDVEKVDVSQEIAWVQGLFSFNEESLGDIMTELSRWYDVNVFFEFSEQKKFVFTGIVERTESIDKILELIEETSMGQVKFKIKDKTVIVK